jgi:hypothetical protein
MLEREIWLRWLVEGIEGEIGHRIEIAIFGDEEGQD